MRQHPALQSDSFGGVQSSSRASSLAQAATSSMGEPLSPSIRADMEQRFGHDFAHVRVHADQRAAASADLLHAPAYASGSDLVFGADQYLPESDAGRDLLAHELAHVVQSDVGALAESPELDEGPSDPSERAAEQLAHAATHEGHDHGHDHGHSGPCQCPKCRAEQGLPPLPGTEGESCGCGGGKESGGGAVESTHAESAAAPESVHRAPWEQRREPGAAPAGHTARDDYQGPHGAVTRDESPAKLGDSTWLGGLVSYGCYCGPGGKDDTGSRCGAGAAAVDEIDEQCRQHDANYHLRHVDSGDTPGTHNMFSSKEGWLDAADADDRLATTVAQAMDANPGGFSPSARLYGQGIKGIFGGRSALSGGYQWGSQRYGEAESGLTGAYGDASSFLSDRYGMGSELLGAEFGRVGSFADASLNRAGAGINSFLSSASGWSSAGDVAGGLLGGASDALSFLGQTGVEGLTGALGGINDVQGFGMDTLLSGGGGALNALGSGASWAGNTLVEATGGLGSAALGVGKWGMDTQGAIADVGLDLLGRGASSLIDSASQLSPRDIAGPLIASPVVENWLKDLW